MTVEHFDVLIVGAGLSGICAGYHLQNRCPGKRYAILESREAIGGTWDLFRYPGIRSDSDMYTLGFPFRPWTHDKSIADGPAIRDYVRDTAREFGIDRHIRFRHRVLAANWSSADARWIVEAEVGPGRERVTYSCAFLYLCSGYYSYESGYTPPLSNIEAFKGHVVHPQHWPEDLDYSGQRVVVIGSGATAVTLVPALAEKAAHVTMLQRSPTYIVALPARDPAAQRLRRLLPPKAAYKAIRAKNVLLSMAFYQLCRRFPSLARRMIRRGALRLLPPGYPVDTHFNPSYQPWDQRLCVAREADLFRAIRRNRASVVTDQIETFTENGVRLRSGKQLAADLIVTATGLKLVPCGGIRIAVDGNAVDLGRTFSYKGLMVSGVPNMAVCAGYTNASWTLRADLASQYVCRLLNHMGRKGYKACVPRLDGRGMQARPLLNLTSGYVQRSVDAFPKQGGRPPWTMPQNYLLDLISLKYSPIADRALEFLRADSRQLHGRATPSATDSSLRAP